MNRYKNVDEIYGPSPALEAIKDIIAFREVPEEDRVYAIARHVEELQEQRNDSP